VVDVESGILAKGVGEQELTKKILIGQFAYSVAKCDKHMMLNAANFSLTKTVTHFGSTTR